MFEFLKRGTIEIIPEKYNYSAGETVRGKITYQLKKPTQANKLTVSITGQRQYITYGAPVRNMANAQSTLQNQQSRQDHTDQIYFFEMPLDNSKEYTQGEYSFEIKLPESLDIVAKDTLDPNGVLGQVVKTGVILNSVLGGQTQRTNIRTDWFIDAAIDIPGAIDMRKRLPINVG